MAEKTSLVPDFTYQKLIEEIRTRQLKDTILETLYSYIDSVDEYRLIYRSNTANSKLIRYPTCNCQDIQH